MDRRVVGWFAGRHVDQTHVGGKFRHGVLENTLNYAFFGVHFLMRIRAFWLNEQHEPAHEVSSFLHMSPHFLLREGKPVGFPSRKFSLFLWGKVLIVSQTL